MSTFGEEDNKQCSEITWKRLAGSCVENTVVIGSAVPTVMSAVAYKPLVILHKLSLTTNNVHVHVHAATSNVVLLYMIGAQF